ncbi:HutD/Ves family protein [Anaeromicrobium sediminis]|uniref:HutD-family protein n=1 Tax=Anaeromicrobium sediminis TaxID=1478221 RepID=A0A267MPP8_9FIRM|nr:HutD family protein [Anaeromicrobium sediminis]PAB60700.1 hypothetical protein CCE28_03945 [Anaeromicrobium sediminis]
MNYNIELIKGSDLITRQWSGGTTTEIAIRPKDSIYKDKNFKWRISSAKVEVDESTFTSLPNVDRILMVLKGELKLEHEGHHSCELREFDQDSFSGDWTTKSFGKVTDFNLMTIGCSGRVEPIKLDENNVVSFSEEENQDVALYCVNGETHVEIDEEESIILKEGDTCLISSIKEKVAISILNKESKANVVKVNVMY